MGRRGRTQHRTLTELVAILWPAGDDWGLVFERNTVRVRVTQWSDEDIARLTVFGAKITWGVGLTAPLGDIDRILARLPNPLTKQWLIDRGAESIG